MSSQQNCIHTNFTTSLRIVFLSRLIVLIWLWLWSSLYASFNSNSDLISMYGNAFWYVPRCDLVFNILRLSFPRSYYFCFSCSLLFVCNLMLLTIRAFCCRRALLFSSIHLYLQMFEYLSRSPHRCFSARNNQQALSTHKTKKKKRFLTRWGAIQGTQNGNILLSQIDTKQWPVSLTSGTSECKKTHNEPLLHFGLFLPFYTLIRECPIKIHLVLYLTVRFVFTFLLTRSILCTT